MMCAAEQALCCIRSLRRCPDTFGVDNLTRCTMRRFHRGVHHWYFVPSSTFVWGRHV